MMAFVLLLVSCKDDVTPSNPFEDVIRYQTPMSTLESEVQTSLADGLPNMFDVFNAYEAVMGQWGDEQCPVFNNTTGNADGHWVDDCVTTDGTRFNGFVLYSGFQDSVGSDAFGSRFGNIWGSFEAIRSNGSRRAIGGMGQLNVLPEEGSFDMFVDGAFWMNPNFKWMQTGTASFAVERVSIDAMRVSGGVQYPNVTLSFDEMRYELNRCGGVLQGRLRLRDATGYWFEIEREDCENCQTIVWEGYPVGELCIGDDLDSAMSSLIEQVTSVID